MAAMEMTAAGGLPIGSSPTARRRRASDSQIPHSGGPTRQIGLGKTGAFTVSGMPIPDVNQWGLAGTDIAPADTDKIDGADDVELPVKDDTMKIVRHNRCFLHPHGIPGSEARGWAPDRPWMSGCRYHDMVKETIYMKASKDMDNLRKVHDLRHQREAERAEFSKSRFNRQRETATLWADMQDTIRVMQGKPEGPTFESLAETLNVEPAASSAPPASAASSSSPPRRASGASPATGAAATPPAGASYLPRKSASMPGLGKVPCIRSGKLVREGGRGHGRISVGLAGPNDFVPFKQEPGSRGLPPDFCPAQPSNMGVAVWDRNRSHTIAGRRARGWD